MSIVTNGKAKKAAPKKSAPKNRIKDANEEFGLPALAESTDLQRVRVKLKGLPPGYLHNANRMSLEDGPTPGSKLTPEQECEKIVHRVPGSKQIALPWEHIYNAIVAAASKVKMGKGNYSQLVAANISTEDDFIGLTRNGKPLTEYEVYARPVRIPPRTGGMVIKGRPLMKQWEAEFDIIVDTEYFVNKTGPVDLEKLFTVILKMAGKLIGVGASRPANRRPNGKFSVVSVQLV